MVYLVLNIIHIGYREVNNMPRQYTVNGASINTDTVLLELLSAEPTIKKYAEETIRKQFFEPAVREMKADFESHVVTQELDAASDNVNATDNRSRTLRGSNFGNLFSFIGFDEGTKPTNAIRNRLNETSAAGPKMATLPVKQKQFIYEFEISGPNLEEIYEATPLPWAPGLSWAEKLENGIEGLGRFLSKSGRGRSGGGFQAKAPVRQGVSKSAPIDYLSGIAKRFIDRFL